MMQRRRRRCTRFHTIVTLFSYVYSINAHEWITSRNCLGRYSLNVPLCLVSLENDECLALDQMIGTNTTTTTAWRVTLEATRTYNIETLELSSCIQTLELQGNKTRIQFNTSSLWIGEQLTTLVLSGLDLSNIALLQLPTSLKTLHITDCVLNKLPVKWLLSQLQLETLVLVNNNVMDTTRTLTELSDEQFKLLSSRVSGYLALESRVEVDQITACVKEKGGSVQKIGTWSVCVIPDDAAVIARRLLLFASIESDDTSLASSGSGLNDDQDTSTLVMASFALPFIYCLYKIGLFIFFARTRNRHCSENGGAIGRVTRDDTKNVTTATTCDSDGNRPTVNDSSASSQHSSSSRVHRKQDEHQSNSDNAGFWVNEELQPWRLDFQQLKMLRCLNLLPTVKRQTLRKQSVTSAMNPREIWLASLAKEDVSMATVSIGGDTMVVAKFMALKEDQGPRLSSSSITRNKLNRELKRQASFSHPRVVTFVGVAWSRETHLIAVTEYMAQGDLRQWLHRTAGAQSGKWSVLKVQMLLDVNRALLYLHSMNPCRMHGNCNSRNVLFDQSLRAKLSDFGVDGPESLTEQELMSYSAVGSGRWISPEALLGCETSASYPDASDVYSFGILVAEMDSHELPFSDLMQANRSAVPETDILQLIARGALSPTLSSSCPTSVVKLVSACTSYKPKDRPSSTQVQQQLLHILEDFQEFESKTTARISVGAPC